MRHSLIIFDIDGTLTDTVCMDADIFFNTFMKYLGIEQLNNNWDEYRYSTDSGLALELFEKHIGRAPIDKELYGIKEDFFRALLNKIEQEPACCTSIPGAEFLLQQILQTKHWDTAIATGGWQKSALMKLRHAKIDHQGTPIATGDDHIERHEIIKIAIERAKQHYSKNSYDRIIYVGDREWDYKAAQYLGIGFIGMGHALRKTHFNIPMMRDYRDGHFLDLLNTSVVV